VWKLYGKRLDGWDNEDLPYEATPGDPTSLRQHGKPVENTPKNRNLAHIAYTGSQMPPPEAVAGTYVGPDGKKIKVPALSDEEKKTFVRWIDLGCPIDLTGDLTHPGWVLDDQRPTLTMTYPRAGKNDALPRITIGMHDYGTGLEMKTFQVTADFPIHGMVAGTNLSGQFRVKSQGVWELAIENPPANLKSATLTVTVRDRQGNESRIERKFSVGK
jgi:hypothetical protein